MHATAVVVTPAERDALWAWWTDYAESDHHGHAFARYGNVARRVVWYERGKGVEYLDEGKVIGFPFHARTVASFHAPERVSARSESNIGDLESEYWFEPLPGGGTRLTARARYEERPMPRAVAPVVRVALGKTLGATLGYDLRAHVAEFERQSAGPR